MFFVLFMSDRVSISWVSTDLRRAYIRTFLLTYMCLFSRLTASYYEGLVVRYLIMIAGDVDFQVVETHQLFHFIIIYNYFTS